jgi:hypothetical protein
MRLRSSLLFSTLIVAFPGYLIAQAGSSGLTFLKLGTSAHGIALADAMSAMVTGPASTHYNPSGLAGGDTLANAEVLFTHREWIEDTRVEALSASIRLGENDAVGFAINSTTVTDIELRTRPGEAEGTFTARSFAGSASYARSLSEEVRLGVTARFLYEKILVDDASGFSVDCGAQFDTPVDNLTVGATIANLGRMSSMRQERSSLPALVRLGSVYYIDIEEGLYESALAVDFVHVFPDKQDFLNCGGEFIYQRWVSVQAGYQFGSDGRGLTAGIGFHHGIFGLQYAYAKLSENLGSAHSFSLAVTL